MKSIKDMSLGELAAFICSHLKSNGVECVLSGGACVSIYSDNQYQSFDLDFIESKYYKRSNIKNILNEIGFFEENRYFKSKETDYFVEFSKGPLAVGSEPVKSIVEKSFSTGELTLISATDCIKDRLAAYYHWNDNQCLNQALLVAKNNNVDLKEIRRWSVEEGNEKQFKEFKKAISN